VCKESISSTIAGPAAGTPDGYPAHRSKVAKQFAADRAGRLRLVFLPSYSPELNPDSHGARQDQLWRAPFAFPVSR
jgi:hypothetical protein